MEQICARSGLIGDIIRKQYAAASVAGRWGSGAEFFTDFAVPIDVVPVPSETQDSIGFAFFDIEGVDGETARTPDGSNLIMCRLECSDSGMISCLECFNFGGGWPTAYYVWRLGDVEAAPRLQNG